MLTGLGSKLPWVSTEACFSSVPGLVSTKSGGMAPANAHRQGMAILNSSASYFCEGDGLHQDPEGGGGLCDYIRTLKVHLLYEPSAIIILQPPREGRDTETHTHTDRQTKRDRDRERYDQANRPIRRFFSGSRSSATRTRVTSSSSASKPDTSLQGGRGVRERGVRERGERKGSGKY